MRVQPKQRRRIVQDARATSGEGACWNPRHCHDYPPEPPRKKSPALLAALEKMESICGTGAR